jgi:hypothetical protein
LLFGATVGLGACVEDEGMFYVTKLGFPDLGRGCEDAFPDAAYAFNVVVRDRNVAFAENLVRLCMNNKMKSSRRNGVETSNIIVSEVEISFSDGGGRRQAVIGLLAADAEDGSTGISKPEPSVIFEAFTVDEFNNYVAQAASAGGVFETVASVRVFGRTTGGMDVDTPEYFFPVRIFSETTDCYCEPPDVDPPPPQCPDDHPFTSVCGQ